jgi:two-component system chemotaxis sensor kinase CheA
MAPKKPVDEFEQFRVTFFEECSEILADMEERLANVRDGTVDNEELNAIFRAVHSIKAGAGAFKFQELVQFSHIYEALLDLLRDGAIEQNEAVSDVLIRSGDVLAELVEAAQEGRDVPENFGADVAAELEKMVADAKGEAVQAVESDDGKSASEAETESGDDPEPSARTYRISFRPHAELFRHANEPLLLVRELQTLGTLSVEADYTRLPVLTALEPEDACINWTMRLETDHAEADIVEVFEFVDEDCDLEVELQKDIPSEETNQPVSDTDDDEKTPDIASAPMKKSIASPDQGDAATSGRKKISSVRVDLDRVDRLVNMVGELVITQAVLTEQMNDNESGGAPQFAQGLEDLATHTRDIQECVMAIRMQPVKSVFARMPRLVRDIAAKLDKKVKLVTEGEQTEVDKTVIEEIADPLTHMIRNSADHGIEDAAVRLAAGKPEEGTIKLSASHRGGSILIQITDDGGGINRERVLEKAIESGIISGDVSLTDEEIDNLIFAPGFSTAETVTDVSGRGVGMDVVRRNIANLGGRVSVQSMPGKGTQFTLVLPLTLAVLDGMTVAVGNEKYILPLTSIIESIRPDKDQVSNVVGAGQVVAIRGEFVPLVYLYRIFDVPGAVSDPWKGLVVLVETDSGSKIGIIVDELIGQQQVVIKSIQDNFDPVAGISGATILGNGMVALILDIDHLSQMTERTIISDRPVEQSVESESNQPDVEATAPVTELTPENWEHPPTEQEAASVTERAIGPE